MTGDSGAMSGGRTPAVLDFSTVYQEYAKDVRRFALFLSGDASTADDIVSETFIRLWSARSRVDLRTVKAYLFTIARNLFLQHRRYARRQEPLGQAELDGPIDPLDPERQTRMRSELQAVLTALQELPELDRAALLMRAEDGLPYEEIAAALDISAGAARVKVHRARLFLAKRTAERAPLEQER